MKCRHTWKKKNLHTSTYSITSVCCKCGKERMKALGFYFTDGTRIILRAYHEYQNDIRFAICPEEDLDNFEKKMLLK